MNLSFCFAGDGRMANFVSDPIVQQRLHFHMEGKFTP